MNYWCEDLHLRCFQESWKRYCTLSVLLIYQINVVLTICDCWLLQNLGERQQVISLTDCKLNCFFFANINSPISPSPPPCLNIDPSNQIFPISLYTLRAYWQEFTVYYWGKTSFEGTDQRRAKRTRVSKCNYNVVGKTGEAHEIIYHNKSDDVECVEDMKKHGMHIQQNWCAGPRNFFQGSNIEELL